MAKLANQYTPLLCLFIVCKLLMSCGEDTRHDRTPNPTQDLPEYTLIEPSKNYFLEDPNCSSTTTSKYSLTTAKVYSADSQGLQSHQKELFGVESQLYLKSPIIKDTYYGGLYEAECAESEVESCQDTYLNVSEWKVIEERRPLTLCRGDGDYKRLSYESIAATLAYTLQNASSTALDYISDLSLEPVTLEVIPNFRVRRRGYSLNGENTDVLLYATHQMSYSPSSQSIIVYPEKDGLPANRPQFWESEFVVSHEFGHHIERTLKLELVSESKASAFTDFIEGSKDDRRSDKALSEAFADLLAFYSLKESPFALSEFPRDFQDRNPLNSIFSDNRTTKVLNQKVLDIFESQKDSQYSEQYKVDLKRMHLIGAIFAHGLHKLFTTMAAAKLGKLEDTHLTSTEDKYRFTYVWFKELNKIKLRELANGGWSQYEPFDVFAESLTATIIQIRSEFKVPLSTFNRGFCESFQTSWPSLNEPDFC